MNNNTQTAHDLRMFVDSSGTIWFGTDREQGRAHVSEFSIARVLEQSWLKNAERIRILGFRSNTDLICALYEARLADPHSVAETIQLGSPAFIDSEVRDDPYQVLSLMDELCLPSSCGGWHEMTEHDYNAYQLLKYTCGATELTPDISELIKLHPAYPAVSFIPTHNLLEAAKLLSEIIDPRWFVDPTKPDRSSRLRSYLGMHIDIVERVMSGTADGNRHRRASNVLRAWSGGNYESAVTSPGNFLLRMVRDSETRDKGMLKACIRYVSFIKNVWLDRIALKGRTLFVPEYFFEHEEEAYAYKAHASRHS